MPSPGSGIQVFTLNVPTSGVGTPQAVNGKQLMGYQVDSLPGGTKFTVVHSLDDPSSTPAAWQPAAEDQSDATVIAANGTLQPLIQVTNWLAIQQVQGNPSAAVVRVITVGLAPWQAGMTLQAKVFQSVVDLLTFINNPANGANSIVAITTDNSGSFTLVYS